jgi:hypothetical protein
VRAAERAARWAGARARPRTASVSVDPALADRAREALVRLTGADVRVAAGRLEIRYAGETELAELCEALETAARRLPLAS